MDENGALEIRPNSRLEQYLLRKWLDDYRNGKVTLHINYKVGPGQFVSEEVPADPRQGQAE